MGKCRDFKYAGEVDNSKSQPTDDKLSLKGAWSHHMTYFNSLWLLLLKYLACLKLQTSNFIDWFAIWSVCLEMAKCPSNGCVGLVTNFKFWSPQSYHWNDWSNSRQILYTCRPYKVNHWDDNFPGMTIFTLLGMARVKWPLEIFGNKRLYLKSSAR